jgi:hypothetical protein
VCKYEGSCICVLLVFRKNLAAFGGHVFDRFPGFTAKYQSMSFGILAVHFNNSLNIRFTFSMMCG